MNLITQIYIADRLYLQEEHQGNNSVYHEFIQYAVSDQEIENDTAGSVMLELERLLPRGASARIVKAITRDAAAVLVSSKKQINPNRLPKLQAALEPLEQEFTRVVLQLSVSLEPDAPYYSIYSYEGDWRTGNWTQDEPARLDAGIAPN